VEANKSSLKGQNRRDEMRMDRRKVWGGEKEIQ
jgi:hypothetical protein